MGCCEHHGKNVLQTKKKRKGIQEITLEGIIGVRIITVLQKVWKENARSTIR